MERPTPFLETLKFELRVRRKGVPMEKGHVLYVLKEKWNGLLVNRGIDCGRDDLMCLLNPFHFPAHINYFSQPLLQLGGTM